MPRTFLGPLLLAIASSPLVGLLAAFDAPKLASLYAVRCTLGLLSSLALIQVRSREGVRVCPPGVLVFEFVLAIACALTCATRAPRALACAYVPCDKRTHKLSYALRCSGHACHAEALQL